MARSLTALDLVCFVTANVGRAPLVYSSGTPELVPILQTHSGRQAGAEALDCLFSMTAGVLVQNGDRRITVAGGETSGAVAQVVTDQLGISAMNIGPEIDPEVPILTIGQDAPVALALKSGNFGAEDFFAKTLRKMAGVGS